MTEALVHRVRIGVYVHAEPERLQATLASLIANTPAAYEAVLLGDGPDEPTRRTIDALDGFERSITSDARGTAACFNRLIATSQSDVLVLLESGSIVSMGWLERLMTVFDADPCNGLVGPSTNLCWNEQGVYPGAAGDAGAIARTAAAAFDRFGAASRTLEPLYSLADFCYVVRRAVVDAIGDADETYGLGPCWEMDYNVRAARAGFRGIWACGAYVHRSPMTARRAAEESRRFDASRQRYQDKFCGARLRGEKTDYRGHCRGDACSNFAPSPLLRLLPIASPPAVRCTESEPLVSCIMPTANRRRFVPVAIRCFLRQNYRRSELIVVDDGTDPIEDCLPADERIRYFRIGHKLTIGAKRNLACSHARGSIVMHWDDDDWYPTTRIRHQVSEIVDRGSDLCGSTRVLYFDPAAERAWEYRYSGTGARWVAGNTLAYRKALWERHPFADWQVGEDTHFIRTCRDARIGDLADPLLCAAMVHDGNTSRKDTSGVFWHPRPFGDVRRLLGDDLRTLIADVRVDSASEWPLVSCIMPTFNRRALVPLALELFRRQDYPHRELIVVDDGTDSIEDLLAGHPNVRYHRLPRRSSIGTKRNFACEHARGDLITHWDDDDWYAPERLRYQAAPILSGQADITGLENAFVLDVPRGRFWTTQPELHRRMFVGDVHGGTLMFRRQLWLDGVRYPDISLAEDAYFIDRARKAGRRLLRLANSGIFVYMRHDHNTWRECVPGRFISADGWRPIAPPASFPADAVAVYQAALRVA